MVRAMQFRRNTIKLLVLAAISLPLSCEAVLGIEDAEPDPLAGSAFSALCHSYCDTAATSCSNEQEIYVNQDTCLGFCDKLPPGRDGDQVGNTVECRLHQAELALSTGEPNVHCALAGPGGGETCGSSCEAYCVVLEQVCPSFFTDEYTAVTECITRCRQDIFDLGSYDTSMDTGDSLQCRLYHLSAASVDPGLHCPHASGHDPCID